MIAHHNHKQVDPNNDTTSDAEQRGKKTRKSHKKESDANLVHSSNTDNLLGVLVPSLGRDDAMLLMINGHMCAKL